MRENKLIGAAVVVTIVTFTAIGCERDRKIDVGTGPGLSATEMPSQEREGDQTEERAVQGGAPTAIGGGPVDPEAAVSRIASARCARDQSCGLVDDQGKWASAEACLEVASREYSDDLTAEDCPDGVDGKELSECVAASRVAECSLAIDVIGRVPECRNPHLCGGH